MSGGYFYYQQVNIEQIADEVAHMIWENVVRKHPYSDETIQKFREAEKTLRRAYAMVQRIDWLESGDDGEDTFHERWKEDLDKIERGGSDAE